MKGGIKIGISILFAFLTLGTPLLSSATLIDDLQQQINDRNQKIADLEKEIAEYEKQVNLTSQQAKTLKNLISTLDTTRKKLDADISVTQNKISITNLAINQLHEQIDDQQDQIDQNKDAISEIIRRMNQTDDRSLLEGMLSSASVSNVLDEIQNLQDIQEKVHAHVAQIQGLKTQLEGKKTESEQKKVELVSYQQDLSGQKQAVVYDTQQKNKLLVQTKSQEASYQKLLDQKKALRDAMQKELSDYESQLKIAIDPNSVPSAKTGVLSWPLSSVRITQYFGNTDFALAHAAVYNGQGHNGIDLAASVGTPIKAALNGVVKGTGDTDLACPGGSYGRWVLIEHPNGLSTLYAHLSVIGVSAGQQVTTGSVIGYSGFTGYATGPHLHFTVYATQGVKIINRASKACNATYTLPVADYKAYLNPLSYLPSLQ